MKSSWVIVLVCIFVAVFAGLNAIDHPGTVLAQGPPGVIPVSTSPAGNPCYSPTPLQVTNPGGVLNTCQNGTWGVLGATGPTGPGGATVFVTPSGDTTGATDSAAIATAYGSGGKLVHLETSVGPFYINAAISQANPGWIDCDGPGSNPIYATSATMNYVSQTFNIAGGGPGDTQAGGMRNCQLAPKSGVTPSAGSAFLMGSGNAGFYTQNLHDENILINGAYTCFTAQTGLLTGFITGSACDSPVHNCIYYDDPVPGGDNYFGVQCFGASGNLTVNRNDRTSIHDLKLNGGGSMIFTGAGTSQNLACINCSIEGTGYSGVPSCAVDFGTGTKPVRVQFIGGEIDLTPTAFCNATTAFIDGTASLNGTIVKSTNLLGSTATVSPYMYTLGTITSACGMYQTFDSFVGGSGTPLSSHLDNCFHQWALWTSGPDSHVIQLNGNGFAVSPIGNGSFYNLVVPSTADYTVSFNCTSGSSGSSTTVCAAWGRMSLVANTAYEALNVGGTCQLFSVVAGTGVQIGSNVSCAWNSGVTHRLGLSMQGSTITLLIDGVATAATGTDVSISAAGYSGIRVNDTTTISLFSVQ